jgi:hypothetical protein
MSLVIIDAGWEAVEKIKDYCPCQEWNPDHPSPSQ